MTTRTKLALCAGLLAVAVGVAVVVRSPAKPEVTMGFVRYGSEAQTTFTLRLSNTLSSKVLCDYEHKVTFMLEPHEEIEEEFLIPASASSNVVFGIYSPNLYHRLHRLLEGAGIPFQGWPRAVSITLPPRGSNAPAQPVTP